jgi:anti-sigma factor RsiW
VTAAHLDHEALADFAEGILDDATATTAEEHLADCADCRKRAAEVAEVSRVLAEAPTPPMPAHLVDRLDAAIAAEAASHVPAHRHGVGGTSVRSVLDAKAGPSEQDGPALGQAWISG